MVYPKWSPMVAQAAATETEKFIEYVFTQKQGDINEILTAGYSFPTPLTASIYGMPAPASGATGPIQLPQAQRKGVLTQISILAAGATETQDHPVLRGKLIRENFFCTYIPNPPAMDQNGQPFTPPTIVPVQGSTTRQQYEGAVSNNFCGSCHALMNPLGFFFEHYDAVGAFRTTEQNLAVNSADTLAGTDIDAMYPDGMSLSTAMAGSASVEKCLVTHWFDYALGRAPVAATASSPGDDPLFNTIKTSAGSKLVGAIQQIVQSNAFRFQRLQ
jgi:hypothetical protein